MFIGRRLDGSIYGLWAVRQPDDADHPRVEEVADDHPDLVSYLAAIQAAAIAEQQRLDSLKADALAQDLLTRLRAATPQQINAYVDNNVVDLASARTMFKRVLLVLALIARG